MVDVLSRLRDSGGGREQGADGDEPDARAERISRYAPAYEANYGFESVLVEARQRNVLERLAEWRPATVVEAGCGTDLLFVRAEELGIPFGRWVIVEPSARFASMAAERAGNSERVTVLQMFLEDSVAEINQACGGRIDAVVCSSLLHEVPRPDQLLRAACELIRSEGRLYVDVPNALSLHRRLARAMGLIEHESDLGARNRMFEQGRVYDAAALRAELVGAGLAPVDQGGYFLKPFTHWQMESAEFLDTRMTEGLRILGGDLPDLAAEIFAVAVPDTR